MGRHHSAGSAIDIMLPRLLIKYIWILDLLFLLSCSNRAIITNPIQINGFDSKKWKQDSLSCKNKRPNLAKILIENKDRLIKLKKAQILDLLGKPNGDKYKTFGYFIESGTQCRNIGKNDHTDVQTKLLLVEFSNDVVSDVYIIMP